ncbi:MAG: RNA polymerase sigma-70 factor [Bacteroides sp.]|nr:RNA polymerase sigma-70 factor [Bacteroides sp.]
MPHSIKGNIKQQGEGIILTKKNFDDFFKEYYTLFLSFTIRYGLPEEEAKDIVQDVFISFWGQRTNFPSLPAVKSFFYRAISNACLDYLKHEDVKKRYAESQLKQMASEEFIHENVIREEVSFIIRQKIKKLTPREQEIIILSLQEKSIQEIADLLKLSIATVKSHKMHAYARLRTELEELRFLLLLL